ncbi:MAG: hypothetical protein ACLRZ6_04535 [Lachnospiraceae bacterium]
MALPCATQNELDLRMQTVKGKRMLQ